jgi:glyoxylase-like metal-dependent hydrolase (beta-lactamase superfamily II)
MSNQPHWTEPGAYPVADGVHRIPLPLPMDGLRAVNVYVIETDSGLTCVDGGWAIEVSRTQFDTSLRSLGYDVRDIRRFLVTHAHRDHYTQAIAIRRELGLAEVGLGLGEKRTIDLINGPMTADPTVSRLEVAGATAVADEWRAMTHGVKPELLDYAGPDIWFSDDDSIPVGVRSLRAVATPGHTQGHFVFADETEGLLFAGDHVLPTITPSVGFEPAYAENPLGDYLASLVKVRSLPDLQVLPAHGAVGMSSHARVDELLAHHDERLDLCLAAVTAGQATAYDVAAELPWTRHGKALSELDLFNKAMAAMETMVHLDLLVAQDRLTREVVDGVAAYSLGA